MTTQAANDSISPSVALLPAEVVVSDDVLRTAERLGIEGQLPQVVALARELFGDPIRLTVVEDPELEGWTHISLQAAPKGTIEEVVAKEERWCDLMLERRLSRWFTLRDD